MKIEKEDNGKEGRFAIYDNDEFAGELTFKWDGDKIFIIDHTEVKEEFGGKGFGKKLVMAAIDYAREKKVKIQPDCPYAEKLMDRDESTNDVRA